MVEVRTLTVDGTTYDIKDATARTDISTLESYVPDDTTESNKLVNTAGVHNSTITIKQGSAVKGTFTLNQSGDAEIQLDAGGTGGGYLLEPKFVDHVLNNQSWLRSDLFTWAAASTYAEAYQHLANDWSSGYTAKSETIGETTIYYREAADGHKICGTDQEQAVQDIYEATGIAWYYIIDEVNGRFKLPRSKYNFVGYRDELGKYVEAGLPNIEGGFNPNTRGDFQLSGAFYDTGIAGYWYHEGGSWGQQTYSKVFGLDASRSNSIYGASDTVQAPATQMYLYFYVGQFSQSATEQTAGVTTETLNAKMDVDKIQVVTEIPEHPVNDVWYGIAGA